MEEKKVRIQCPKCKTFLNVGNPKNEPMVQFLCPVCKAPLRVAFQKAPNNNAPSPGETQYVPGPGYSQPGTSGGETQYPGGGGLPQPGETQIAPVQAKPGYLLFRGKSYPLQVGPNSVGRAAATSQADVQIETSDRYMSRQHFKIFVHRMTNGGLKAILSNDQNKNATYVNGQKIAGSDQIELADGYQIECGDTIITYKA